MTGHRKSGFPMLPKNLISASLSPNEHVFGVLSWASIPTVVAKACLMHVLTVSPLACITRFTTFEG